MRMAFLFRKPLPDKLKRAGVAALLGVFAETFDVQPPDVSSMSCPDALYTFREFSAACMEEALASPAYAQARRADLESRARNLGSTARRLLKPRDAELPELVSALYAAIEIQVEGDMPGRLRFHRCYFSERYTPGLCWFMSAFDSGFVGGLAGGGSLSFESRLTEGAPCCMALFETFDVPPKSFGEAHRKRLLEEVR